MNLNTKIAIYGLGYIGLPTAALFANSGLEVRGVARNKKKIEMINKGISPINETGLEKLLNKAISNGTLYATDQGVESAIKSDIMIVIVPTPMDKFKRADLNAVKSTCNTISKGLKKGNLVIIESTVPQGTCNNIVIPLLEKSGLRAGKDFGVAYTPERAIPNNTIYEMTHNARVIGGLDSKSTNMAVKLYKKITNGEIITVSNLITAETVKLIENTFRDVNIALANEIAMICEVIGVDAIEAINTANYHPRVNIHTPGPGVGGHCLAIDPYFIVETAKEHGIDAPIISTCRNTNEGMPNHVTKLIIDALSEVNKNIQNVTIGILGIAYKGNVDDARESPAEHLIQILREKGAEVYANDPLVPNSTIISIGATPKSINKVLECDCVVLLTDHDAFKEIKPKQIKNKVFVCTRPILNLEIFKANDIVIKGVGRY